MRLNIQTLTLAEFAKTLDHSLLQPQLTTAEVEAGLVLAQQYRTASVCVKPYHVTLAAQRLSASDVLVSTVVGFPHGSATPAIKLAEARQALAEGAVELDMVLNYGALRAGEVSLVAAEVQAICELAHAQQAKVKVIFENAYLDEAQKIAACQLCEQAGADWVKTSTGFAPTGATVADIRLMRANVSERVQVKAAHGVRTLAAALTMIEAGVTRIGATATATMCEDFKRWRSGELQLELGEVGGAY